MAEKITAKVAHYSIAIKVCILFSCMAYYIPLMAWWSVSLGCLPLSSSFFFLFWLLHHFFLIGKRAIDMLKRQKMLHPVHRKYTSAHQRKKTQKPSSFWQPNQSIKSIIEGDSCPRPPLINSKMLHRKENFSSWPLFPNSPKQTKRSNIPLLSPLPNGFSYAN